MSLLALPPGNFSLEEKLKNDLNRKFGSVLFLEGFKSSSYFRQAKERKIVTFHSLTRSSNDPDIQSKIDDFMELSDNSKKLRQIIQSADFSICDNPANIVRRNIMHLNSLVIFISKVFLENIRNSLYACFVADFLIERPVVDNLDPIYLSRRNRLTPYVIHKKIRVAQITDKLCELGHISDEMKEHLVAWFGVDTINMDTFSWTKLYLHPNEHRSFFEENNIPVREMEIGCPLFNFLEPYFVQLEGPNSPGLKIVKEMSTRLFDSYHI